MRYVMSKCAYIFFAYFYEVDKKVAIIYEMRRKKILALFHLIYWPHGLRKRLLSVDFETYEDKWFVFIYNFAETFPLPFLDAQCAHSSPWSTDDSDHRCKFNVFIIIITSTTTTSTTSTMFYSVCGVTEIVLLHDPKDLFLH